MSVMRSEQSRFHIVDVSPWPVIVSIGVGSTCIGGVRYMTSGRGGVISLGLCVMILGIGMWLRDVIREGTYEGQHTSGVQGGMRMGMMLFIVSEVMFFVAFFWAYMWSSMGVSWEVGGVWPPKGISREGGEIGLWNTVILLSSGVSITWAHHSVVSGKRGEGLVGLGITIGLALIFSMMQVYEYSNAESSISSGVYGSTVYMATGFHGAHVLIGTIMISVSMIRLYKNELTRQHHFGLEGSAWYWHFVDVVWVLLYICVYVW